MYAPPASGDPLINRDRKRIAPDVARGSEANKVVLTENRLDLAEVSVSVFVAMPDLFAI
jgi:hypothetical protein